MADTTKPIRPLPIRVEFNGWGLATDGTALSVTRPDGAVSEWTRRPESQGTGMYDLCMAIIHDRNADEIDPKLEADNAAALASIPKPDAPVPECTSLHAGEEWRECSACNPPASPDQDTMVDASDDPAAMNAALVELAGLLGCNCERDEMVEAIDKLQRDAEDVDGLRDQLEQVRARGVDALRTLWLVVREAGGAATIPVRAMLTADWSTCQLARSDNLATGDVELFAQVRGEQAKPRTTQHQAMHQQLLDMLGAIDHQGAAGRIGELVGLELLLNAGGAGRGVTAIAQERRGQIEREGYAPSEDDEYTAGELAQAACAYITWEWSEADDREGHLAVHWPASWNPAAFKPKDRRSDLVRAGALLAAEIDRLDRKAAGHG